MIFILQAQWNETVTQALSKAAFDCIRSQSAIACETIKVPGALELPLVAQWIAESKKTSVMGIVACGCIIKGDTLHFDLVATESARGLCEVSLKYSIPITHAILAVYRKEDALERSRPHQNKGEEAALSLLQMIQTRQQLQGGLN
jgi:6,7-dimethyl-8-ribityllumazine synthase